VSGIGFGTADEIAVKLGLPRDSIPRLATGLKYVLAQAAMKMDIAFCRNMNCCAGPLRYSGRL